MIWSIRNRFTLVIAIMFLAILGLLFLTGFWSVNNAVDTALKQELQSEAAVVRQLVISRYIPEAESPGITRDQQKKQLLKSLDALYRYQNKCVLLNLVDSQSRSILASGGDRNIHLAIPEGLFQRQDGFYTAKLLGNNYKFLISQHPWGTLAVGKPDVFLEILTRQISGLSKYAIPLTILLVVLSSMILARLVMKPVVEVSDAAATISSLDPRKRLPVYAGRDEFGNLVETLNAMLGRLEEATLLVQRFTQDAAHELRTPLTIMRGELELLNETDNISEENRASIQKALDRAISMGALIDNLLLLMRSDSGKYPFQLKRFDFHNLVEQVAEDLVILLGERPVKVIVQCDRFTYLGDPQLLERLILNLAENAANHTHAGQITMTLTNPESGPQFCIEDTGDGIPAEDLERILDRFYRVRRSDNSGEHGSGLGLAICRWIVQAHKGNMNIYSEPGMVPGSPFTCHPLSSKPQAPDTPSYIAFPFSASFQFQFVS